MVCERVVNMSSDVCTPESPGWVVSETDTEYLFVVREEPFQWFERQSLWLSDNFAVVDEKFPQSAPEHSEVGFCSVRLVEEAEVLTTAGPWLKTWIEQFTEAKGAVIQREPAGCTVIAVEVSLAVANAHPVGDQCR